MCTWLYVSHIRKDTLSPVCFVRKWKYFVFIYLLVLKYVSFRCMHIFSAQFYFHEFSMIFRFFLIFLWRFFLQWICAYEFVCLSLVYFLSFSIVIFLCSHSHFSLFDNHYIFHNEKFSIFASATGCLFHSIRHMHRRDV